MPKEIQCATSPTEGEDCKMHFTPRYLRKYWFELDYRNSARDCWIEKITQAFWRKVGGVSEAERRALGSSSCISRDDRCAAMQLICRALVQNT